MAEAYDICVIGLGPVGAVSALCFARQGFRVYGVDVNPERIGAFEAGSLPFIEPGTHELLTQVASNFQVASHLSEVAESCRIFMICVGTPTPPEADSPDLSALDAVAEQLGKVVQPGAVLVLRSTVPPGTLRNRFGPLVEKHSGLKAGGDFHLAANPEFLREGSAIEDFFDAGRVVIGAETPAIAEQIAALYPEVSGERIFTTLESAEFAKYVDNSWHALKVAFANEIGRVVQGFGGDVEETTRIFLADHKLNLSAKYLRPGFAFGGSCLPKDVRGLGSLARQQGVSLPVISAILPSNEEQIRQGVTAILATGAKKIGLLGVSFKPGVDDCRESPALAVAEQLVAAGCEVFAHDACATANVPIPLLPLDEVIAQAGLLVKFQDLPDYEALDTLNLNALFRTPRSG